MGSRLTLATAAAAFGLLVAACTSAATPSPSAAPSTAPSVLPSESASAEPTAAPTVGPSVATTPVAAVPADQLKFPAKLVACIDIPYPPQEFFDAQGNPKGSDVDVAAEIATRLGLELEVENSVFDTIIAAVTGGKCDIIVSAQNITPDRVKQVDMIPYFQAGQSFVVAKGNPKGIATADDLCGKAIAAQTGTTEVDYLSGTGDYKGDGLSKACVDKGKAKIDVKEFIKDNDALAAMLATQVDAYFADSPVAGYYTVQFPDQFQLSGIPPLQPAKEGISVPKDKTSLRDAVKAALLSMIDDGMYTKILTTYGVQDGAITAADIK